MTTPTIVVHGGAGGCDDERIPTVRAGCLAAVAAGLEVLAAGGSALDAVQRAVRVLEDDPEFNAGVGAALARDGAVELDAAIMDGATLRVGAIGAVENLRRPIDLARAVLDDGEHILLVGPAAWDFAREHGFAPVDAAEMTTARARERLAAVLAGRQRTSSGGTVGACALDAAGHVAAATSTGGITGKRRGRVGDTPLPGTGTYADDQLGAASATGHGESIIRVTLARVVLDAIGRGADADASCRAALDDMRRRVAGEGGIICVTPSGQVGIAHTTVRMPAAHAALGRDPVFVIEAA